MNKKPLITAGLAQFKTLPNKITFLRVLAIPIFTVFYNLDFEIMRILAALVFLAAASTDFLDGYAARILQQTSRVGALLDPLADKILVTCGLILLASHSVIYSWIAMLLISREIFVSGIRLLALEQQVTIAVQFSGKIKTATQLFAIFALMLERTYLGIPWLELGHIAIWIAMGLSLYSGYEYAREYLEQCESHKDS